jgi:hypothetical protein
MNSYEEKQERRRERLEMRAARLKAESNAAYKRSGDAVAGIPFGQPILVGHHSEKRHRRAIERSRNAMDKCCELSNEAADVARRADAVGSGGISSDDPEAVQKLESKLAEMVARHAAIKAKPEHACWELSNSSANIRRVKERIAQLKKPIPEFAEIDAPEYNVSLDRDENRYVLKLKQRVGKDKFKEIRGSGWLWSPRREAFVRKCSPQARWAAQAAGRFFEKKDEIPLDAKAALGSKVEDVQAGRRETVNDEPVAIRAQGVLL